MTIYRYSIGLLLVLSACSGNDALADAQNVGRAYCRAVTTRNEAAAEALMAPALTTGIARLRAADAAFRKTNPGEKPPLGDGLRLTAFADAVERCKAESLLASSTVLTFTLVGAPNGKWHDRLLLERSADGRLLIADIAYGPDEKTRFSQWLAASAG